MDSQGAWLDPEVARLLLRVDGADEFKDDLVKLGTSSLSDSGYAQIDGDAASRHVHPAVSGQSLYEGASLLEADDLERMRLH